MTKVVNPNLESEEHKAIKNLNRAITLSGSNIPEDLLQSRRGTQMNSKDEKQAEHQLD
jgi:hypothetical protein